VREQLRSAGLLTVLYLAVWLCSLSHSHTHTHTTHARARRTSGVRVIMARAFPNKSYTNARSFSPYMRARMYCTTVELTVVGF